MSVLKVFISSTCYDLNIAREGLRKFIVSLGYEPVMSDYSDVLYDPRIHTHTSCVEEVKNCDMLVLIIGGRFGGKAKGEAISKINFEKINQHIDVDEKSNFSITQLEFLKAIECGIPVYSFVEEDVLNDHKLYEKNKDKEIINQITFPSIDKPETAKYIFEFINAVRLKDCGNNIFPFSKLSDIEEILKKQWSSFFQRLLKEQSDIQDKNTGILEKKVDELQELIWKLIKEMPRQKDLQKSSKKHGRILWVDDYPINNEAVISFFEEQGICFDIALTTEQGLKFYKKELYDIIITDMGRGEDSSAGITLIKELNYRHCQVPIIVYCSAQAIRKYGKEARELGAYSVTNGIANIISLITDYLGLDNCGKIRL